MKPTVKKSRIISAIWILPIVAAFICLSLLYTSYKNAGISIELFLKSAAGITAGKTKVMFRGIPVGMVEKISPDLEQTRIRATIKLDAQVENLLVEDTIFWVVRPQLSASSIRGLETILSGSYINVQPGRSDHPRRQFIAAKEQPPPPADTPGLHLVLTAAELGSLQAGSGIYYKNIQIGTVEQTRLIPEEDKVQLKVLIEPHYAQLVRQGSRFCNASGVQMKGSLSSVSLKIASLAALLRGGIELFTPKPLENSAPAENQAVYPLYANFDEADYGLPLTLRLNSSKGLVEGVTKVMYQGMVTGVVKKLEMESGENHRVTAQIQLDPRAAEILREKTRFWLVTPKLSPAGVQNLELLISGSYITFQPGEGGFRDHFEILPTAPPELPQRPGATFHLHTEKGGSPSSGAPILFKNIQIGEVVDVALDSTTQLATTIFIYQDYLHLINEHSLFWVQSGMKMNASLTSGINLESGPLATMLFGGISVSSPRTGKPAEEDQVFPLYSDYSAAVAATPSLQQGGKSVRLTAEDAGSLAAGAPVLFKNIQIGEIEKVELQAAKNIEIDARIYEKYRSLVTDRSRFYQNSGLQVHADLDGLDIQTGSLLSIVAGGISCINQVGFPAKGKGPWKLYNSRDTALDTDSFSITIQLQEAGGIKAGTPIVYKGISIGKVSELRLTKDLKNIIATGKIDRKTKHLFRKGTMIWTEKPQIGIGKVEHAKALVFGPSLTILPGDGPPASDFLLLTKPPLAEIANASGMGIVLETTHLGSITTDSPVYYRQVQVGHVTGYELSPTFQKVQIFVTIKRRFQSLIRLNTRFWNVSGVQVRGGIFSGLTLSTQSLESIVRGGIALATPNTEDLAAAAKAGQHFPLHQQPEESWLDWEPNIKILKKEDTRNFLQSEN